MKAQAATSRPISQADFKDQIVECLLDRKRELIPRRGSMERRDVIVGTGVDHSSGERRLFQTVSSRRT
jgi:hypothetical protein